MFIMLLGVVLRIPFRPINVWLDESGDKQTLGGVYVLRFPYRSGVKRADSCFPMHGGN